jgi:hypothetical protein
LLTRFNLEVSPQIWHDAEPVELHPVAGAEQYHAMTGNPPLHRPGDSVAPVCGHRLGMDGHYPRL